MPTWLASCCCTLAVSMLAHVQCCAWWHAVSVVSRLGVCQNVCKFGDFGTHFGTLNIILIMCVLSSDNAMHATIGIMMLHNDTHA